VTGRSPQVGPVRRRRNSDIRELLHNLSIVARAGLARDAEPLDADDVVIRTNDLTKVYPGMDRPAVDNLNLEVRRGEIFGLLGPNGAGKTTTGGMLTTMVIPTSGGAVVGDIDVVSNPALAKQAIGVVPQQNTLDRALTVWENLYFHGRFFGMSAADCRTAADDLLEEFHLARWAKAPVMALSGGMAQRLMVARAILHRPEIVFLDEPTAGLDPQSRLALWEILQRLHAGGQTILLTTHYMEEADQLCNRVAIMDHGHILALDTPAELKDGIDADTIVSLRVSGDLDKLEKALNRRRVVTNVVHLDGELRVHVKGAADALPAVLDTVSKSGSHLIDLTVTEPTLETVFINLTGKELRE
jgi:ABC-2 type transport system ATP-binding protein